MVAVGVIVRLAVRDAVGVIESVLVAVAVDGTKVLVRVGVAVLVLVAVGVEVTVRVGVWVTVAVAVGVEVGFVPVTVPTKLDTLETGKE